MNIKNCQSELLGHSDEVQILRTLPNNELASGSADNTIKIWNTETCSLKFTLVGHVGNILCLVVLPDNELASGSTDKTIRIWNTQLGFFLFLLSIDNMISKPLKFLKGSTRLVLAGHEGDVYVMKYLPTGELASGSEDATINIWNVQTGECRMTLGAHSDWIWCLQVISKTEIASGIIKFICNQDIFKLN